MRLLFSVHSTQFNWTCSFTHNNSFFLPEVTKSKPATECNVIHHTRWLSNTIFCIPNQIPSHRAWEHQNICATKLKSITSHGHILATKNMKEQTRQPNLFHVVCRSSGKNAVAGGCFCWCLYGLWCWLTDWRAHAFINNSRSLADWLMRTKTVWLLNENKMITKMYNN